MSRGQAGTEDSKKAATASQVIEECLNLTRPASFFLYAGAGSGKTRSLVEALKYVQTKGRHQLRVKGQQVAVITYTKAACDEIKRRIGHDPLVVVQTIHSFTWEQLVKGFTGDIKEWLSAELLADIAELKNELAKGRPGTKTDATRRRSIESKTRRRSKFVLHPTP